MVYQKPVRKGGATARADGDAGGKVAALRVATAALVMVRLGWRVNHRRFYRRTGARD